MGAGERFPPFASKRAICIQVIGPIYGQCGAIVTGVNKYLQSHGIDTEEPGKLDNSAEPSDVIEDVDGVAFLFLHQSHCDDFSDPQVLNEPVIEALQFWALAYSTRSENTILLYEDTNETIADHGLYGDLIEQLTDATELTAAENEIEDIKEKVFTHCSNFEL
ncbi:hypothetical protein [Salinirussus salinus]|uniref:hypothetical protein n=1 Tax=Salinirussus salinus TaxID=1198300 RepID=UPI00135BFD5F|nr:hypothetical protein [Salinirussus salinus]